MENQWASHNNANPKSSASSSTPPSSDAPLTPAVQSHSSSASRSRCHPVICDVMRLETIRERNSVYSEDGEFIDLPLPPVPQSSNTATDSTVSDCVGRDREHEQQMPAVKNRADAYLQSRLQDFEEEDGPIGNGYIGEGDCVEEIILAPLAMDNNINFRSTLHGRAVDEEIKSIDSSTSNTLRKSAWSVVSTGSTGGGCSSDDFSEGDDSEGEDGNQAEEDDYGERSSGYRDKSPFLRSVSLSPVERRFRKQSVPARQRRRKSVSSAGKHSSESGGNWSHQRADVHDAGDYVCCDDDFTWVQAHGRSEAPKASVESDRRSSSQATTSRSVPPEQRGQVMPPKQQPQRQLTRSSPSSTSGVVGSGKPPRPLRETGSLDRRRNLSTSRHERDGKSRSTHSLKKSSSSDLHKHDSLSSNLSLNSKDQLHDSGSFNNYNSSGSGSLYQQRHQHQHNPRHSPSIWEPPPPPPLAHWDPHYYWGYPHYHHQHQHQSREELRLIDYHRRQQELYQYGSNSNLGSAQDLSCSSGCCNRGYFPPPFPPPPGACCSYDQRPQCSKEFQRQDTDERLRRLQTDKEALAMQVKTLTEQVQSQSTKISELERTVKEKNQLLSNAEDLLQREMLSRSSLETQKLELMSAMSELKLQQAALERENLELRTNFVTSTGGLMNGSLTTSSNGNGSPLTNVLNNNSISMLRRPQIITNTRMVGMSASTPGNSLNLSPMHHGSHGSLPQTAVSPITPKTPPATYRQRIDVHYSSLPRQAFATTLSTVSTSSGSSTATDSNANPRRNVAFGKCSVAYEDYLTHTSNAVTGKAEESFSAPIGDESKKSDQRSDKNSVPVFTESASSVNYVAYGTRSINSSMADKTGTDQINSAFGMSSSMNALSFDRALSSNLTNMQTTSTSAQEFLFDQTADECSNVTSATADPSDDPRKQERANTEPPSSKFADEPENTSSKREGQTSSGECDTSSSQALTSETHNKRHLKLQIFSAAPTSRHRNSKIDKLRGFSVPNLAESENGNEDRSEGVPPARSYTPQPSPSPSMSNKLKNIFGKIKRSNSGTLEDLAGADSEFKRGGIRATAGARLGWSGTVPYRKPDKPFREWELDAVCQWFDHLGLNMYEEELRRWLKSSMAPAVDLIKASPVDIEKELNLRNPLHRKKIVLAVADISGTEDEDELFKAAGMLDTAWILRWLDDIGMPQYKDTFTAARMDGRMLHKLTFDDLATLQMSSCLHVASIRRGIQLMRHEKWQPDCLVRRPLPPDTNAKDDVRLWTSQRVHEWLRVVDLAEYSPNLRGSGVHGALMIFEVKFTAELFADLLSIPASKTLLRRHLATHFKDLLGRDIIQVKREAENTLGFQPLTISSKIKTPKKSQFSLKRKKSAKGGQLGEEWSDYVCPMGGSGQEHLPSATYASSTNNSTNNSNVSPGASTAFTSNASSNANPNNVTSIGMTKNPSMVPTACPGSTTSSTTSTTTFGVESEPVSLPPQPLSSVMSQMIATGSGTNGGGCGSDSPVSTRSSTTSTS